MNAHQKTNREIEDLCVATSNRRTYDNHIKFAHALGVFYRDVRKATDMTQVKAAIETLEEMCT